MEFRRRLDSARRALDNEFSEASQAGDATDNLDTLHRFLAEVGMLLTDLERLQKKHFT